MLHCPVHQIIDCQLILFQNPKLTAAKPNPCIGTIHATGIYRNLCHEMAFTGRLRIGENLTFVGYTHQPVFIALHAIGPSVFHRHGIFGS